MASSPAKQLFMLDTNAVSDALHHPQGGVACRLGRLAPGEAVISVVVEGELRYGTAKASAAILELRVDAFLTRIDVVNVDSAVAHRYGALRTHLADQGTPFGMNDLWIAAHALELGLTLVTNDEVEFRRVPGLVVDNWQRRPT